MDIILWYSVISSSIFSKDGARSVSLLYCMPWSPGFLNCFLLEADWAFASITEARSSEYFLDDSLFES